MQENLKVALLQADLVWEDSAQNRKNFSEQIDALTKPVDLIILPEMFSTGFSMKPKKLAENMQGPTVKWMQEKAYEKGAALCGSLIISDNGLFYNRLIFAEPEGHIHTYDKRHTFTLAGEHKAYKAGNKRLLINYKGWNICPLICYDLRFPVWSRNTVAYDLLIYVANWPKPRIEAWNCLLKARAIENMCFCIGLNRVGLDNNGYEYTGHSSAYDSLGALISKPAVNSISSEILEISKPDLIKTRQKFQFLEDRDQFKILN